VGTEKTFGPFGFPPPHPGPPSEMVQGGHLLGRADKPYPGTSGDTKG
jgi:hypothetical protein